jgi:uncharacterized membrane protein
MGRLHPLIVHLPIGILCLVAISEWLGAKPKWQLLRPAILVMWACGALSAVIACVSGYLLANGGSYEQNAVDWHQWTAISFTLFSLVLFIIRKRAHYQNGRLVAIITLFWLSLTGHFGGSLTHGSDFLVAPFTGGSEEAVIKRIPLANVQEAMVYEDIIAPILQNKCTSCHGSSKQKGKLALHKPQAIQRGGKSGSDVLAAVPMPVEIGIGRPKNNTIQNRIHLPLEDEDHMPPKKKAQLSTTEKQLINWWINEKAPFDKSVIELSPADTINSLLQLWNQQTDITHSALEPKNIAAYLPAVDLPEVKPEDLEQIRRYNILVLPAGEDSRFLEVNFVNVSDFSEELFNSLTPIVSHIVKLKLSEQPIADRHLHLVGRMKNLTRLYLDYTQITNTGLAQLQGLEHLLSLHLVGTQVSNEGLAVLEKLPQLERIYGFQTALKTPQSSMELTIDTGGYRVPTFQSDTIQIPQ